MKLVKAFFEDGLTSFFEELIPEHAWLILFSFYSQLNCHSSRLYLRNYVRTLAPFINFLIFKEIERVKPLKRVDELVSGIVPELKENSTDSAEEVIF